MIATSWFFSSGDGTPLVLWVLYYWFTSKYLPVYKWQTLLYSMTVIRMSFSGLFLLENPVPDFDGGEAFSQKISVVAIWTIINLEIHLKVMAAWVYWTCFLAVQLNFSISGTCSLLDAHFRDMTRSSISARRGSNSLSACISVILEPRFRHIW